MTFWSIVTVLAFISTASCLQTLYMEEGCGSAISFFQRNEDALILRLSRNPTHRPNIDCVVAIEPPLGKELAITFRDLDIESAPNGQCTTDFLRLYDGRTGQAQFMQGLPQTICGTPLTSPLLQQARMTRSFETQLGYLTIQFQSRSPVVTRRGFELLITAFRRGGGSCQRDEARCNNQRCISGNLKCSGYDHCGDGTKLCLLTYEATVAVGVVAAVVVIIIIIIIVACVVKNKRKNDMNDEIQKDRYKKEQIKTINPESIKIHTVSGSNGHLR